jgi:hypothetical protein
MGGDADGRRPSFDRILTTTERLLEPPAIAAMTHGRTCGDVRSKVRSTLTTSWNMLTSSSGVHLFGVTIDAVTI